MAGSIPTISSGVAGPLGAIHLPRLWQKVLLSASGKLAEGYDECGMGFDQMVLDGLKLDREQALSFLKGSRPSYPEFEAWVLKQRGGSIPIQEIDELNAAVKGYNHGDDVRKDILSAAGIEDKGTIKDAVSLNNLDDWTEFHKSLK